MVSDCRSRWCYPWEQAVLILVVMEDGLWLRRSQRSRRSSGSLNPCCNGRWSLTLFGKTFKVITEKRLNHCCNGRWSLTGQWYYRKKCQCVLILVVMEDGLWPTTRRTTRTGMCLNPCCNGRWSLTNCISYQPCTKCYCLNPCCSGRWSLTEAGNVNEVILLTS